MTQSNYKLAFFFSGGLGKFLVLSCSLRVVALSIRGDGGMRREGESGEGADLRLRDLALAFPCRALECQLSSNLLMAGINCRGWLAAPRRRRQRLNPQRLASLLCGIFASLWPFSVTFFCKRKKSPAELFFFFWF